MTTSHVPQPGHADTAPALPANVTTLTSAYTARAFLMTAFKALVLWSDHTLNGRHEDADAEKRTAVDALRRAAKVFGYRLVKEGEA